MKTAISNKRKIKKGIHYYEDVEKATQVRDKLLKAFPTARIVPYTIGFAIQYYKSGPYYPEGVEK